MSVCPANRALIPLPMVTLASLCTILVGLSLIAAWRAASGARAAVREAAQARERETLSLETMRSLIDASRVSSDAVMATLAERIRSGEPAIDAVLAFVPSGGDLACVYATGARVDHLARVRVPRASSEYLPARAAAAGHRVEGSEGVIIPTDRHALAVPMLDRSGLRAVVYASSSTLVVQPRSESIVRTIECAASPFAIALEREADRADATYDGLTGLLTPRAFRARLRDEVERAHLGAASVLTLWFIDTDHFKAVNDTHGHASGDIVLQGMAALLRAHTVADVDLVARNGGDEFCALIFDAQKTVAIERAQALCEAVRSHAFGLPMAVTASIGVASYPYDAKDASELLEVADAAMYHSKRNGRDRVSFAVDGMTFAAFR